MEKGLKELADKNCQYCHGEGKRFNGYFDYPCACINGVFETFGTSEIQFREEEIARLRLENTTLLKKMDKLIDEKMTLEKKVKTLTSGKGLSALLHIWKYNNKIHDGDWDSMFVPELLEELEGK